MENLRKGLVGYLENADLPVQEILFVETDAHPVWSDNTEILETANRQILEPSGALPDEHILAYIGVHAQTILTGKRDSVGFLITNFRTLTQTDYSVIGTAKTADILPFTTKISASKTVAHLWEQFITKNILTIPEEQLAAMRTALQNVLQIVIPNLQQLNILPQEILKSGNISERITELGLQSTLKTYSQDEKKLRKFEEKYNVADIRFGIVDKPLFGGVYGLVISGKGITSRDLMEESFTSSWQEIAENPAVAGDKNDVILAGGKTHIVPSHSSEYVPQLIILINELATGEVIL
jgi:hypothetical protein